MSEDVVAELDAWLEREATTLNHYPNDDTDTDLLQRARDEIVALRRLTDGNWVWKQITDTRAGALEEAAQLVEEMPIVPIAMASDIAAAIRALKDKG